jgi:hypothetical protein
MMRERGFVTFVLGCAVIACGCETGVVPPSGDAMADGTDAAADGAGVACSLLVASCPDDQGCYPYPFEGVIPTTATRCAFQGIGDDSIPCQSQLDCDGQSICRGLGDPSAVCLLRCDTTAPHCPPGTGCSPLPGFPGVGTCAL